MPLTDRGRALLGHLPAIVTTPSSGLGCEITRHDELCVGCGICAANCPTGASHRGATFDVAQLLEAPPESRRGALGAALRRVMRQAPDAPIEVPPRVTVYRTIHHDASKCLGCGTCVRGCPAKAIGERPPQLGLAGVGVGPGSVR